MNTDCIDKKILLRAQRKRVWRAISESTEFGSWFRMPRWTSENRPTERGTRTTLFITWDEASGQTFFVRRSAAGLY